MPTRMVRTPHNRKCKNIFSQGKGLSPQRGPVDALDCPKGKNNQPNLSLERHKLGVCRNSARPRVHGLNPLKGAAQCSPVRSNEGNTAT